MTAVGRVARLLGRLALGGALLTVAFVLVGSASADPQTFTVTTAADPGPTGCDPTGCSLRGAIAAANAAHGGTIDFDIPATAAPPSIALGSPLEPITAPVTIDGTTQPGTATDAPGVNILPQWSGVSGDVIDLGPGSDGSTVKGLAFGGIASEAGSTAIEVESNGNTITGNWIGVATDGTLLGTGNAGIDITGSDNTIGGGAAGEPNVVAGGLAGIIVEASEGPTTAPVGNVIQGNLLGLEPDGTPAGGGDIGIHISQSMNTVVGNDDNASQLLDVQEHPELGNEIAGFGDAIDINDGSTGTIAAGNFIGVDRGGDATSPNSDGVVVEGDETIDNSGNTNGNQIGPGNVIAHSYDDGVTVDGRFANANGNRIVANSIFDNDTDESGSLGIDLRQGDGTSANDDLAAPVITQVTKGGGGTAYGSITGPQGDTVWIELFGNATCADAASGEGRDYAGYVQVQLPESGLSTSTADWVADLGGVPGYDLGLTATATDVATNDTSEFSDCADVPGNFVVTNQNDDGPGSLRQAITDADADTAGGTITFHIFEGGPKSIPVVEGPLPEITRSVTIDGTSEPGYAGTPLIFLDGTECDGCSSGLSVTAGTGSVIEGLGVSNFSGYGIDVEGSADSTLVQQNVVSGNNRGGIFVQGGTDTALYGNFVGTDPTGTLAVGNGTGGDGIDVTFGDGITIGGTGAGQGNLISGNAGDGIHVSGSADGTSIEGNLIGLDASGFDALPNGGAGVRIDGENYDNTIAGNTISGNTDGIVLYEDGVYTTSITGNMIGTNPEGTAAIGNAGDGIVLEDIYEPGISVGGTDAASRNVVSGNGGFGIHIEGGDGVTVEGNYVGTDVSGSVAVPNQADGIGLDGSTDNTIGGTDPGAGNLVSGNEYAGISLVEFADGNNIQGNSIGIDASGAAAIPNGGDGIAIGTADNTIGYSDGGAGNVISGNGGDGLSIHGSEATDNSVGGNLIGTDASGTSAIGNFERGVFISASASDNTVGGRSPGDQNVISGNGNPSAGGGIAIGTQAGGGNVVDGNNIGTDSTGTKQLGNANFGISIDGSGETVGQNDGGGNTIAFNGGPGVWVTSGTGDTIRFNSIHDNAGLGIELDGNANNGAAAPHLSAATVQTGYTQLMGSLSAPDGDYTVDFYDSPSCDPSGAGEGATPIGSTDVTVAGGTGTFDTGDQITYPVAVGDAVTATATDSAGDTSAFSQCATASLPGGGTLSGTMTVKGFNPVDLTGTGTTDWAVWDYGDTNTGNEPASALTPNVTKVNGGNEISPLTIDNSDGTPTRGFAGWGGQGLLPFGFSWTDGTPVTTATGAFAGLTAPKLGQGLSFTVPADTTPRTLTIWTSAHWADGTLTAHLSDGSAPNFTRTLHSVSGSDPSTIDNLPAVFTIHYQAASADQHLTISWDETANNCGNCDDIVIYAAALSGGGNAVGASASFGSGPSVQMSGTVPISNIPLAAFDPQPPGAPPISTPDGLQLGHTQLGHTQLGHTQLGQTQLGHTQLGHTQLGHTQLGHTQLGQTQLGQTQLGHTQLGHTQLGQTLLDESSLTLNTVPLDPVLHPDGWPGLLAGTTLANEPLQTVTLGEVLSLTAANVPSPPNGMTAQQVIDRIQGLTFADIDLSDSVLGNITLDALTLGGSLINQLGGALENQIESQLNAWCLSIVPAGDPGNFCGGADPGIGYFSLMQLGLIGAPVDTLQLGHTQLGQTQLGHTQLGQTPVGNLAGSASGIVGMQLSRIDLTAGLGIADLHVGSLLPADQNNLFDCSNPANFNCSTGTLSQAWTAGAIKPTTLVGDLDVDNFLQDVTIGQLLDNVRGPQSAYQDLVTFGDVVGLLIRSVDVSWESLQPDLLTIFDPNRHQLAMSAGFTIVGTGSPPADVKVDLPAGFDFVPGSAALTENDDGSTPLADPTITDNGSGIELDWPLAAVDAGSPYTLTFDAFSGTTVGPTQATETVTAGGHSDSSVAAFSVTDSNPGNDTAASATPIDTTPGHDTVEMSTLPKPGAVDYYSFPMPPAGTRISVHLTDLPADYDLALYSPQTTSVRTGAPSAPPLQDGVVPDQQVNLDGGSSGQLTPTGLEDVPDPGIPLVQLSDNRHEDDEDVGMVSPGGAGQVTVAVFGYNGAFSPDAYTLRVRETPPAAPESCTARTPSSFPDAGQGTTIDSLPSLSTLPANLNTIILVNEKRLGNTYGATAEANAVAKLNHFAGDASLGVSGVVVPVETIPSPPTGGPSVQSLYDTWDTNPCDPNAANAVANAIANEVDAIVAARPTVKYVVFGGGDDEIPFFRLPDLSLIANESGFADQFSDNEYFGSLAAGDLLSDDPYLDTQPVPASGQQLFPPNLAGGRLVETAQEIANAVTAFETAPTPGALKSSTGFVSGYDFVADGSQRVADNLTRLGVSVRTLDNPLSATSDWGASDLLGTAGAFPAAGPANINSWNGHYDNYRAQMANGDIISTSDLPAGLNNGIFFTMGCHAGFQTTDAVVGSSVDDWPQYFSDHNTGFVGNTGFGLGETDSVAFSEELMADFAGQLGGRVTLGQALMLAKQQYYMSRVAFSNYDEKTLSEAELYGLPNYGVGRSPTSLAGPTGPFSDPVPGTTHSTSPSTGSLSPFTTGVQSASFSATPSFSALQHGLNGEFFTNAGQVQAPNYRPLQPYVSLPAARPGVAAHGVVIDSLTSSDTTGFTPDNVRPTLNSSASEPPPTFTDEAWPEKIPTLVSLGSNQQLNLATGQYFTDTSGSTPVGVERLWTGINGRVTYSNSSDFTPPTIDSIDAYLSNGILAFTGSFSDLDQNGNPGTVAFAQVVYDDGTGNWNALPLQYNATSQTWSGGVPFRGSSIQYFVEVCDAAGNCGYSSNKGRYFDAAPLSAGTGTGGSLTITPSRPPDTGTPKTWYTGSLGVNATGSAPEISVSVDGGSFMPSTSGPFTLAGDGAHVVQAKDSEGDTATAVYLIDTTGPVVTHTISPAAPNGTNNWYVTKPTVTFACTDNLSGVKSCLVDGGSSNSTTLNEGASQGATATGTDNAGNSGHDSISGIKVDVTAPATPTFVGIQATTYSPSTVPPSSAISCNSSDATSGLKSCVVTGYGSALGPHTLTATATDNAGNTSTATLTYSVKSTPTISWNTPAGIVVGTKLSSTQLNATASVPGTFVYIPPAGTALPAGLNQTLSVTFTPTNTANYTTATATQKINVFSQACQTGGLSGNLTVKSGTAYCIQGGKVSGSVTVQSGGSLYISGGAISGSITSTGAKALTFCGSSFSGQISISSTTGPVLIGGPSGSGCSADKASATLALSSNTGGVTIFGDTISGNVTATNNSGGFVFSGNIGSGSVTLNGNSGGVTFTNNTISCNVSISNSTGGFTFTGNKITGKTTLTNNH